MNISWKTLGAFCFALAAGTGQPGMALAPATAAVQKGETLIRIEGLARTELVNPAAGAQTTVTSAPVKLQVGQLYRLSATIRTQGVRTDPMARYPTALGACLSMKSFPFTNASATVAGDRTEPVSVLFFATSASDAVQLNLGRNGNATGSAAFSDLKLERVDDIRAYIPLETVRWAGKGFRYDDGGWICLHIEGEPYERGRQYGELVATELAAFVDKLANLQDKADPAKGWNSMRGITDAVMLRKYETEFLEEMKGIADGAAKAGAKFRGREIDLLDIVAINSAIDISEMDKAASVTATPLSGRTFLKAEDEAANAGQGDRCSSFIATKSASSDGRIVMGQIFMWPPGYSGVQWDVMVDVQPTKGHRFVMQTFPGGISSGTDWYVNDAGIIIGETTVAQTPFDADGTPEANRVRKAAQYATSIDEVAGILTEKNNGLYTNDWTIADIKTDEGAVFLLGTHKTKMWRTGSQGHAADTPGNLKDFLWADNNNRDLEVRKELVPNHDNHPVDLAFNTWNRDIAFWDFYKEYGQGKFDLAAGVKMNASSPINRPHACDGKLTTSEMAEKLMFVAHYGKTTLREKWVGSRFMADLPGAVPHLSLGFTTFSPVTVAEQLKAARKANKVAANPRPAAKPDLAKIKDSLGFPRELLWSNTVFPANDGVNWFVSGSAAYHAMLKRLPESPDKAQDSLRDAFADLNARYNYFASKEGSLAVSKAATSYDRYGAYQLPRIKGTFLLHQLRLLLGNKAFAKTLGAVHGRFANKPMSNEDFIKTASEAAGRDLRGFVAPWLDRDDLPNPSLAATVSKAGDGWDLQLKVNQSGFAYSFLATVQIQDAKGARIERLEVKNGAASFSFHSTEKPTLVQFNAGQDLPVPMANPYTLPNQMDDFDHLLFVQGTSRQVESNRSLLLNYREQLADNFTEILPPVKTDAEVSAQELKDSDLILFGSPEDNTVLARMAAQHSLPVTFQRGSFTFQGRTYGRADDGLALAFPNPWNPKRTVYLYAANSLMQVWHMTHAFQRGLPGYVQFRGAEVTTKGILREPRFELALK
jgi:hypothetical protein